MSTAYSTLPIRGIDQSVTPFRSKPDTVFDLFNLRHSVSQFGTLEQTSYFDRRQFSQGTYYSGGVQTEPPTSNIRMFKYGFTMTDYVLWNASAPGGAAQVPVFYQSVNTAAATVNTGCKMVINNLAGLAITLGNSVDVEMTGAATFRWRKNGGAWNAGVPSTAGVAIDGGNATLYFLANNGFAGTETWSWQRTDCSCSNLAYLDGGATCVGIFYKLVCYYTSPDFRVMLQARSATDNALYAISVGYRPVYGRFLVVFDDHLVVGGYSTSAGYWYTSPRNYTMGWSDKADLDNFVPTDVNEADFLELWNTSQNDYVSSTQFTIAGLTVLRQQMYVFTTAGLFSTSALGLPLVFSFQFNEFIKIEYANVPFIVANDKTYIFGKSGIYSFNGSDLRKISDPIFNVVPNFVAQAAYDDKREELILYRNDFQNQSLYCYQEKYDAWYRRGVAFGRAATALSVGINGTVILGSSSRYAYYDGAVSIALTYDAENGTSYAKPRIVTQVFSNELASVLEVATAYVGAAVTTQNTTYFSTDSDVLFTVSWYTSNDGLLSLASPQTAAAAVYNTSKPDGLVSFPRVAARGVAFQLEISGAVAGKPPYLATVTMFAPGLTVKEKTAR